MHYRTIPNTNTKISTIGVGSAHFEDADANTVTNVIRYGHEQGVNLIDLAMPFEHPLKNMAAALQPIRADMLYQMHLGCIFKNGQYVRSRNLKDVQEGFEAQLRILGTDYTDFGFIHCVDEEGDFNDVFSSGVFEYALRLKKQGVIRYLGFASHTVDTCFRFLETGEIDAFLFSINPAYDMDPVNHYPMGDETAANDLVSVAQKRAKLYQHCEANGIGINVMKPFSAGRLLDARTSPFGAAMTIPQCLQYALDRPAVLSCLTGVRHQEDLKGVLQYYETTPQERDYAFVAKLQPQEMMGKCVYCNHCLPCPSHIDIGLVGKYLDLTLAGDELARQHYLALERTASDCIQCGACEKNCPFGVAVQNRMLKALELFGR